MKGAIIYSGKFGSTRQYADWLQEATRFPIFNTRETHADPGQYDLLLLGTSIIVGRPTLKKWLHRHWAQIRTKPALLFTVSGTAPGHPDLDAWLKRHLTPEMQQHLKIVSLRGRLEIASLPGWLRWMLRLAGRASGDEEASRRMSEGFDFMDRDALQPILDWVRIQHKPDKHPEIILTPV